MNYFYIITPVGSDPEFQAKRQILEAVGRDQGCEPFFPFDHHTEFSIDEACSDLQKARLVVADLSHERPSCYFELGLAQALRTTVVIIAAAGTRIHQVGDAGTICWYLDLQEYRRLVTETLATLACANSELRVRK